MLTSRTSRLALLTVLGALLAAASTTPAASAATQRFASPTGTGYDCSAASPCEINYAVEVAAVSGDEVIVQPGDYSLMQTLRDYGKKLTIHGVAGQPRPRLLFAGGQEGLVMSGASTLRYVEVVQEAPTSSAVDAGYGATVDQVIARASGSAGSAAVYVRDGAAIRNSIVVASGTNARALAALAGSGGIVTSGALNVTAIATGPGGVAILANAGTTASVTLHLVNVIAYGGPGAISLRAQTDSPGAQATITASYTDYQSVGVVGSNAKFQPGGGIRAEEPLFVNPAEGDYRQAPGSYTIDAGIDYSGFDVDGDPRQIGTTDIGADEFVAPPPAPLPPTPPPTSPTTTSTSTSTSPSQASTTQAPAATRAFAGVKLVSTGLSFGGRFVTLRLSCPAATVGRCTGQTKLSARRRRSGSRAAATVALGRAGFSIAAGRQARVRVRVSRAGRGLLGHTPRLRGNATSATRDAAGQSKTTVAKVTIRRRPR